MRPLLLSRRLCRVLAAAMAVIALLDAAGVFADPLRVVTYNIKADAGSTTVGPGFTTVMQGIADEIVNGIARPVDVLSLQETTSNSATVAPIVTSLNNIWGANTYAMSPYQATDNCDTCTGNGPNAMVYKTTTLQLVASVGIGTPSTSGAPRQPVRYQFRPVGGSAALDFYVYVSHMKSGTGSTNENRRNVEAGMLRTNAATLPANARIIYTGDFNWGGSAEAAYVTLAAAGAGQAFDPINRPGNWQNNSAFQDILTESATNLRYRDDCQLVTQNIMNDASGLQYIAGSYHTFGVNGSTPVGGTVNSPSNTALPGLPNRSNVLSALTTATDHLPMVADFMLPAANQPPAITAQPNNDTLCAGGSASFSVAASGTPAPSYQWRKGTTPLSDGGNVSGSQTTSLTINPAGTGDAANNYNCIVTNIAGSATSIDATLTVNVGPTFAVQPANQTVCVGQPASFSVSANGAPAPSFQWRRGAAPLSDGGTFAGTTTPTFTINPVGTGDLAGDYNCVVTNACGTTTSGNASLTGFLAGGGDGNADTLVDGNDIRGFTDLLVSGIQPLAPPCVYDLNGDGMVDLADLDLFADLLVNS